MSHCGAKPPTCPGGCQCGALVRAEEAQKGAERAVRAPVARLQAVRDPLSHREGEETL